MAPTELVRVAGEGDAARWRELVNTCTEHDLVDLPLVTSGQARAMADSCSAETRYDLYLGWRDGQAVAAGSLSGQLHDNMGVASLDLRVHPAHRRRGCGRALLDLLLAEASQSERPRVLAEVWAPPDCDSPATILAARAGFRPVLGAVRRRLDLGRLDLDLVHRLLGEAHPGYELLTWSDHAPEEHLADAALLVGRMSLDAPLGELDWDPEVWDGPRYRAKEADAHREGITRLAVAARHLDSGRLVGYTDLGVDRVEPARVRQFDTIVLTEHRGNRLGAWMKALNLLTLRTAWPAARSVSTFNAASNEHMTAVNTELGFEAMERWWEYERRVVPA